MKKLTITVTGVAGTGKSAVARAIEQALAAHGIEAVVQDDNGIGVIDEKPGTIEASLGDRLASLARNGLPITIRTQMESRNAS